VPAPAPRFGETDPRERLTALAAVLIVQAILAWALISGLRVGIQRPAADAVEQLIEVVLPKAPPPLPPPDPRPRSGPKAERQAPPAPRAAPAPPGARPGPRLVPTAAPIVPSLAMRPAPGSSGAALGSGTAPGTGSGGGPGGAGEGDDGEGGSDLVQIAGAILPSDYPRTLRERGGGGVVGIRFTVGVSGRVTRCAVTRSSGVGELDLLTCRLILQRFVFRPSTDARGRPIAEQVEGEHEWVARRR
jgi:protein TonB